MNSTPILDCWKSTPSPSLLVTYSAHAYVPMYTLNLRLFPGLLGFFLEFIWAIVPLFAKSTACSWWFHRVTGRIGAGAIFNSLLIAWVSASLFPFGTLG